MTTTPAEPRGAALDVSGLPQLAFGPRTLTWWGTLGLMAVEGTVFALAVATYFYLRGLGHQWPMNEGPPLLRWGTLNTVLLLASLWPNQLAKRAAERQDRRAAAIWMTVCLLAAIVFIVLRGFEFTALQCRWYDDAYASVTWTLLALHTTHLVTDAWDTAVLVVLAWRGPFDDKRYTDVSENALYWIFVVATWLPIYATIYWAPRVTL
jgi:heme/copper-type cytochrome/quinol oxidase subunit 3